MQKFDNRKATQLIDLQHSPQWCNANKMGRTLFQLDSVHTLLFQDTQLLTLQPHHLNSLNLLTFALNLLNWLY